MSVAASAADHDAGRVRPWLACAVAVVATHLGLVAWLTNRPWPASSSGPTPAAVMVDLAPLPNAPTAAPPPPAKAREAAPTDEPATARPVPKTTSSPALDAPPKAAVAPARPEAVPPPETAPAKAPAEVVAPDTPSPPVPLLKPDPPPRKSREVAEADPVEARRTPPAPAETMERRAAARPSGGASAIEPTYQAALLAWLERHKRYPARALSREMEGEALLYFVMARDGRVLAHRLLRSSGHDLLDEEVRRMIERASPLPPLPEDVTTSQLELVVPVQFFLR